MNKLKLHYMIAPLGLLLKIYSWVCRGLQVENNKEFNTIDECIDWLKQKSKKDSINFYWPQYYDKQLQKYYCAAWWTEDFMKSL